MLQHAYELVKAGVRECSLESIGAAATLSARINQRLLPNPHLEFLIEIAEAYGAHGICAAHSGTIAGLLFDRGAAAVESARDAIWQKTGSTLVVYTLHS